MEVRILQRFGIGLQICLMSYPIALKNRGTFGRLLISMALYARPHTWPILSADRLFRSEFERGLPPDFLLWRSPMLLVETLIENLIGEVEKIPSFIKHI
jgi:hypothetical protein